MSEDTERKSKPPLWRRVAVIAGQGVLLLAVVWAVSAWQARHLLPRRTPAPSLSLRSLDGEQVSLEDVRGRPAVVYFFAPWCGVCNVASANVVALRRARSSEELAVFAVGLGWEREEDVARFAEEHHLDVPVLLGDDRTLRAWRIQAFPTLYFIDEEGAVSARTVGYTTELGLRLRSL